MPFPIWARANSSKLCFSLSFDRRRFMNLLLLISSVQPVHLLYHICSSHDVLTHFARAKILLGGEPLLNLAWAPSLLSSESSSLEDNSDSLEDSIEETIVPLRKVVLAFGKHQPTLLLLPYFTAIAKHMSIFLWHNFGVRDTSREPTRFACPFG